MILNIRGFPFMQLFYNGFSYINVSYFLRSIVSCIIGIDDK